MPNIIYEFAKLRHSIMSSYDYINMELNLIEIGNKFPARNLITKNDSYHYLANIYARLLDKYSVSEEIIKITEASLFFSMIPLHLESKRKIISFYIQSFSILKSLD